MSTDTKGGQCTANFVFFDGSGNEYIGQAAHCSGTGDSTETDGCTSKSLPLGTPVTVDGATKPGVLAYNSWLTMQSLKERDPETCAYNDLALVKLDPADFGRVNPSVPFFGGPRGLGSTGSGQSVVSYGNSGLRQGIGLLSPKFGTVLSDSGGGWSHTVLTVSPGIPGDSGSAFLNSSGQAIGVLSTLSLTPVPLTNGVGDIGRELAYLRAHGGLGDVQLANGTTGFSSTGSGSRLPATPQEPAGGGSTPAAPATATACRATVSRGTLPKWARAGFTSAKPKAPHSIARAGRIAAIIFGDPLRSPAAKGHANKILWVSRKAPSRRSDLRISAQRMSGTRALGKPVTRVVRGGPGPSTINMPAAGCYRMTLRWSGRVDHVDVRYRSR